MIIQLIPTNLMLVILRNKNSAACLVLGVYAISFVYILHVLVLFVKVIGVKRLVHWDRLSEIPSFLGILRA